VLQKSDYPLFEISWAGYRLNLTTYLHHHHHQNYNYTIDLRKKRSLVP
jgi:hypothetical protein